MTILALAVLFTGAYFTLASRFFQFRKMGTILKNAFSSGNSEDGISPFEALSAALSGTMGVGSILAVTTALCVAGPGALVWMWISALFGMMVKYAEVYICVKYRQKAGDGYVGGPMFALYSAAKKPAAAYLYAGMCLLVSLFSMGNMTQGSAIASVLEKSAGLPRLLSGLLILLILVPLLLGGMRRIGRICGVVFPSMAAIYILGCLVCLYMGRSALPAVISSIFSDAFSLSSFAGGTGFMALRYGITRGLFSNEAGLGTSAMAHASANVQSPEKQGMLGIVEVMINTLVICTLTALVVLLSGVPLQMGADGAALAMEAFSVFLGRSGGLLVTMLILFFALSTMPVWCMYGRQAVHFLFRGNGWADKAYIAAYLICAVAGAVARSFALWEMADLLNLLTALPSLYLLIYLRKEVLGGVLKRA